MVPPDDRLAARPLYMLGEIELPSKQHTNDPAAYIEVLRQMCDAFSEKYFAYEIDLKRNMLSLFKLMLHDMRSNLLSSPSSSASQEDNISAVVQYLYDNMDKPISFETICRLYGYSMSNFRKLFRQKTGLPPNEFLISIRMEKATDLLYNSPYTIAEIAEIIGYSDSHYFSRLYRKKKGVAPSARTKNAST